MLSRLAAVADGGEVSKLARALLNRSADLVAAALVVGGLVTVTLLERNLEDNLDRSLDQQAVDRARLLDEGVYVTAFSYPVVPHGTARIRTQMSSAHTREHLDQAIEAFISVGQELDIIP